MSLNMKQWMKSNGVLAMGAVFAALSATANAADEAAAAASAGGKSWVRVLAAAALGVAALGSALGLGRAVAAAMDAIGRQPEAADSIQRVMIIGCALIEALTIYALVAFFLA